MKSKMTMVISAIVILGGIALVGRSAYNAKFPRTAKVGRINVLLTVDPNWRLKRDTVDPLLPKIRSYLVSGNNAAAIELCNKIIAVDEFEPYGYLYLAQALYNQGKFKDSIKAYEALVYSKNWSSSINKDPTTLLKYSLALAEDKRWVDAVTVYKRVFPDGASIQGIPLLNTNFDPQMPNYKNLEGVCNAVLGVRHPSFEPPPPGEQELRLKQAVKQNPESGTAHYFLAKELLKNGKSEESKAAFSLAEKYGDEDIKVESHRMLSSFVKKVPQKPL